MSSRTPSTNGLTVAPVSAEELSSHGYWGRYTDTTLFPNGSANAASGPAYAALQPGDTAYDSSKGGLYLCQSKGTSGGGDATWVLLTGGGVSANYRLVWEWNETDLSEFDVVGDAGFTASVTDWNTRWGGTWPDETPCIQIDSPATGSFYGILLKQAVLDLSAYEGKDLYITMRCTSVATYDQSPLLIVYYEDDTHQLAAYADGSASGKGLILTWRNGSTTWLDPGQKAQYYETVAGSDSGDSMRVGYRYRQFASGLVKPIIEQRGDFWNENNGDQLMYPLAVQWDLSTNFDASWLALGSYQPRIGFGMRSGGTSLTSPGNVLTDLRIYTYG